MRLIVFLLALLAGIAPLAAGTAAPAPARRDWSAHAQAVPAPGAYAIGNPAAKVTLVEYLSYACPHCAHFAEASAPVLKNRMIRSGSVRLEIRNIVLSNYDFIAVLMGRCVGSQVFPRYHAAVFAAQQTWLQTASDYEQANGAANAAKPPLVRARAMADGAGLTAIARRAGASAQAIDACFATPAALKATLQALGGVRQDVHSTPSFELGGTLLDAHDWAALEPQLRAAGAK